MTRRVQITPIVAPGTAVAVRERAAQQRVSVSQLLRLAIEEMYPGGLGPGKLLGRIEATPPPASAEQLVCVISAGSLAQIDAVRRRHGFRTRAPILRDAIERIYPA